MKHQPYFSSYDIKEDIEKCLNCKMVRCINCLKTERKKEVKYTQKTIDKIIFLHKNGLSGVQISKLVRMSSSFCNKKIREYKAKEVQAGG